MVEAAKDKLVECVLSLSSASKWASRDFDFFNPLSVVAMPLKYWHMHQAKEHYAEAKLSIERFQTYLAAEVNQADLKLFGVAVALDVWAEATGSNVVDLFADAHIAEQTETALLSVNGVLSDVGLLCTKLRAEIDGISRQSS